MDTTFIDSYSKELGISCNIWENTHHKVTYGGNGHIIRFFLLHESENQKEYEKHLLDAHFMPNYPIAERSQVYRLHEGLNIYNIQKQESGPLGIFHVPAYGCLYRMPDNDSGCFAVVCPKPNSASCEAVYFMYHGLEERRPEKLEDSWIHGLAETLTVGELMTGEFMEYMQNTIKHIPGKISYDGVHIAIFENGNIAVKKGGKMYHISESALLAVATEEILTEFHMAKNLA